MPTKHVCKQLMKVLKIKVTKEDIKRHWNGSVFSCPIHVAISRKGVTAEIMAHTYKTDSMEQRVLLPVVAENFSTDQSEFDKSLGIGDRKRAFKTLKPISFEIEVPVQDIRK